MVRSSSSEHVRFRYGMCLNDSCSKCKSKEIQTVSARKELVCSECGKPLRECPPPSGNKNKLVIIIVAAVIILAGIGFGIVKFMGKTDSAEPKVEIPKETIEAPKLVPIDSANVETPQEKRENPQPKKDGYGTVNLGYGIYTGDLKNGVPHGHGTIKYTERHKIVNSKDFIANPGDEFEADFRDGRVSGGIGYWYHDGNQTAIKP